MPMAPTPTTSSPRVSIGVTTEAERSLRVLLISTYELGRQPFGLASPAAWLRRQHHQVQCADLAVGELPESAAAQADVIGFYLPMHTATRLALPLIRRVRALNPSAHICAFGLYAAVNEPHLRELGVETLLAGEFETGLVSLCERLAARDTSEAPVAGHTTTSVDKQQFLLPDRSDLPELHEYAQLRVGDETRVVGYVEASRGCKHLCRHCPVVPVYGGRFRIVPHDIVIEDIRQQIEAGARHITFGDPDFFNGITHAKAVVEELHAQFPDITYDATIKIEHLLKHRDHLPLLRDTGCAFVTSAVESVDDDLLLILDKGHTREDFIRAAKLCDDVGLVLSPTFIPFTPWTTPASYLELLQLLVELDLVDQVAPVQLAIRLLVPQGSLLLELEQVRALLQPLEPEKLGYPWVHVDPEVDALFEGVSGAVREDQGIPARRQTFAAIWSLAHEAAGRAAPPYANKLPATATIPYLTEPWYC